MKYEFNKRDDGFIDINGVQYPPGEFLLVRGESGVVVGGCRIVLMQGESGWRMWVEPVAPGLPMLGHQMIGVRAADGHMVDLVVTDLPDDTLLEWLG